MDNNLIQTALSYRAMNESISIIEVNNNWIIAFGKLRDAVPGIFYTLDNPQLSVNPKTSLIQYGAVIFRMKHSYIELKIDIEHNIPTVTTASTLGNGEFNSVMAGKEIETTQTDFLFLDDKTMERLKFIVEWFKTHDVPW